MLANIILALLRAIGRFFSSLFKGTSRASRTAGKASSGLAAKSTKLSPPSDEELAEKVTSGLEAVFFKQLSRPRLSELSASDLTLEDARLHLAQAEIYYKNPFSLFSRSDFFYEEVEEEYLNQSLGLDNNTVDQRFLLIMSLFRKTLNDNTRRLMLVYAPVLLIISLAGGIFVSNSFASAMTKIISPLNILFLNPDIISTLIIFTAIAFVGFLNAVLLFSWPFKVVQQRNLLNLDNYLTSKFGRINHNFQVAKRRALNVERNKRMGQAEELKDEAGVWTLSYQWFATRLLLCEQMIRNRIYQVRRNTILYWLAGIVICLTIGILSIWASIYLLPVNSNIFWGVLTATVIFILFTFGIYKRTSAMMGTVLEANEWSRFHLIELHKTIKDHVGEDKVQIVTFRDRNRME